MCFLNRAVRHFYVDKHGHYPLPSDTQSMSSCRLLKGAFNFVNTSDPLHLWLHSLYPAISLSLFFLYMSLWRPTCKPRLQGYSMLQGYSALLVLENSQRHLWIEDFAVPNLNWVYNKCWKLSLCQFIVIEVDFLPMDTSDVTTQRACLYNLFIDNYNSDWQNPNK